MVPYPSSRYTAEIFVVLKFQSGSALIVIIYTSQNMGCETSKRIISLCCRGYFKPGIFQSSYFISGFLIQIFCESYHVLLFSHTGLYFFRIFIHNSGNFSRHLFYFCRGFSCSKLSRPYPQSVAGCAGRQFLAVSVIYHSAFCLNRCICSLLQDSLFRIFFRIYNLYPCHPECKRNQKYGNGKKAYRYSSFMF